MSITNATIAQQISDLIGYWDGFNTEYRDWLGGSAVGGPNSDGQYPLTDYQGVTDLVDSPAKLSDSVNNNVSGALAHKDAALAAQVAAEAALTSAQTAETNAETAETGAVSARDSALAAQLAAESARSTAIAQADVATSNAAQTVLDAAATAADAISTAADAAAAAASAAAAATFTPSLYAALADNETITGSWTFGASISITGGANATPAAINNWGFQMAHDSTSSGIYRASIGGELYLRDQLGVTGVRLSGNGVGTFTGAVTASNLAITDWNTAFGWGDHASAGYAAGSHNHAAADITSGVLSVNRLSASQEGATAKKSIIQFNRWGTNQEMGGTTNWDEGIYGGYSTMTNGPVGMNYDPFLVMGSGNDVRSFLVVPRLSSRPIAYKGAYGSGVTHTAWHYTGWTQTEADADLSLYLKAVATAADSTLLTGLGVSAGSSAPVGSQILKSHTNGYIYAGWINTVSGSNTATPTRIYTNNGGSDSFVRYMTPANFRTSVIKDYYLNVDADDTFTGKLSAGNTALRRAGMYGIYDSTKTGHIWSMGTSYVISPTGVDFGNLYGFGYKHTNNTTGGTMASGHQAVWCQNGTPNVALGTNIWTSGKVLPGGNLVGYIDNPTLRGSINVGGAQAGSYSGYSIENIFAFMKSGNTFGLYDENNNRWRWRADLHVNYVSLYNSTTEVVRSDANGLLRVSQGNFLHHASSSHTSAKITVSTSAPSGGANGDVWMKV